ncbi:thiol reductant ABC exporter subunit CydC [Halomonas sp. GFAJ-1]|uniref:thiol reductant ABC exporter subunit CydC n=1 Tax=Halomonas sp. GFAJ-1 TaxID=1118153 RepID=UPI00023A2979|nr:thiol reductant ABC exporter subunit CydC [Halomonas sp. GFAJ-1]AVI63605.1 thiol reductant ABC exporter subunit CydC [Halomonas sp. GFAJ-1]EHK62055.1 ABC transporter-like protein [Halomonas sp. GFAJ-1]
MRRVYREFKPWLALLLRRRQRFLVGVFLVWITLLAGLSLLGLSGWFIAACALAGIALAAGLPSSLDIYVPGGGIRFFALLRTVARYVERLYNHNTVLTLLADLRFRVFGYLTRLDDASLRRRRASDWLSRLTADIDTLDNFYLRLLIPPFVALLCLLVVSAFIAIWLPGVALMVAVSLGLLWLVITLGYAWLGFANSHQQTVDQRELRHLVLDQVQASAELMSYGTSAWHQRKIASHEMDAAANQRRLTLRAALGNALVSIVTGMLVLAVLWLASIALGEGRVNGPIMVMAVLIILGINEAFNLLPSAFIKLGASYAAVQRLNILSVNTLIPASVAFPLENQTYSLRLNSVSFFYPNMLEPALSNVSFVLPAAKRAVITGVSGAGKSTLAQLLMGRASPSSGDVSVAGFAPFTLTEDSRAAHFAMLSQQVDLFDGSLAENLRIAKPSASNKELWRALDQVALSDWAQQQPQKLGTSVGEKGQQLSGGQARRVALARLFLRSPNVVLLDEPFAGVDAQTAQHLARALDDWLQDKTVIYFVHQVDDASLLPGVEYTWRLAEGQLIADTGISS